MWVASGVSITRTAVEWIVHGTIGVQLVDHRPDVEHGEPAQYPHLDGIRIDAYLAELAWAAFR